MLQQRDQELIEAQQSASAATETANAPVAVDSDLQVHLNKAKADNVALKKKLAQAQKEIDEAYSNMSKLV